MTRRPRTLTFAERLQAHGYANYSVYLQSQHWQQVKARYWKNHTRSCQVCGSVRFIELHHKTYRNLGHERNADPTTLCSTCHAGVHDLWKHSSNLNLGSAVRAYSDLKRKRKPRPGQREPIPLGYKRARTPSGKASGLSKNERLHELQVANRKKREQAGLSA